MTRKTRKRKKKWEKYEKVDWGELTVYEFNDFIVVGNKNNGYTLLLKSDDIKIDKSGDVSFMGKDYYGKYKHVLTALAMAKKLGAIVANGENAIVALGGDSGKKYTLGETTYWKDSGAHIIRFPSSYPEVGLHELAHMQLGHMENEKRCGVVRDISQEKEATALEISELKERGKYTPAAKKRIVESLKTYMRGSRRNRHNRAKKYVSSLEIEDEQLDEEEREHFRKLSDIVYKMSD